MPTPGVRLCLRLLPALFGPPLALYGIISAVEAVVHVSVPKLLKCGGLIAVCPLIIASRGLLRTWKDKQDARRLGAVPTPYIKGKWIGNLDVTMDMVKAFNTQYIGESQLGVLVSFSPDCTL